MSTQNPKQSQEKQEVISIITLHQEYNLEQEIMDFISKKGFKIELDSHKDNKESPRLVMYIKK